VYVRTAGAWLLVLHHGSPVIGGPAS